MNGVDYLAIAKAHIAEIDGSHPVEHVKAFSLAAIANALIAIAERMNEMSEYIVDFDEKSSAYMRILLSKTAMNKGEIVRCKDCAYYDNYPNDEISVCYRFDNEQPIVEPDGYCAWAKRRTK